MLRTTCVTRKAHGSGVRAHHQWCMCPHRTRPRAACEPSPPAPHGASEHTLHWPEGGTPPANATGGNDALNASPPYDHAYAGVVASHRLTDE
eukprot:4521070-Pleurochrysis_carterae.AAC.1